MVMRPERGIAEFSHILKDAAKNCIRSHFFVGLHFEQFQSTAIEKIKN